jgi:hypothetical protein
MLLMKMIMVVRQICTQVTRLITYKCEYLPVNSALCNRGRNLNLREELCVFRTREGEDRAVPVPVPFNMSP